MSRQLTKKWKVDGELERKPLKKNRKNKIKKKKSKASIGSIAVLCNVSILAGPNPSMRNTDGKGCKQRQGYARKEWQTEIECY